MGRFSGRITDDNITMFDRLGELRVAFGKGMTKFTAPAVQLGPDDPGRVFSGNYQMNPVGKVISSNIVTPLPTWLETHAGQASLAMGMIFAIAAVADDIDDEINDSNNGVLGRPRRKKSFQIVDFEDFLPESIE